MGSRLPVPTQKGSRGHGVTPPSPDPKGVTGSRAHASQSRPKRGHGVTGSRLPVATQKGSRGHGVTPPSPDPKGVTGSRAHASQSRPKRGHGVTGSRLPVPTQKRSRDHGVTPPSPDPKGPTGSRGHASQSRPKGVTGSRLQVPTQKGPRSHGVTPPSPDSEKKGHRVTPRCPEHCFTQLTHARSDSEHPPSGSKITPLQASPQAKLGFRAAGEEQVLFELLARVSTLPRDGVAGRARAGTAQHS